MSVYVTANTTCKWTYTDELILGHIQTYAYTSNIVMCHYNGFSINDEISKYNSWNNRILFNQCWFEWMLVLKYRGDDFESNVNQKKKLSGVLKLKMYQESRLWRGATSSISSSHKHFLSILMIYRIMIKEPVCNPISVDYWINKTFYFYNHDMIFKMLFVQNIYENCYTLKNTLNSMLLQSQNSEAH